MRKTRSFTFGLTGWVTQGNQQGFFSLQISALQPQDSERRPDHCHPSMPLRHRVDLCHTANRSLTNYGAIAFGLVSNAITSAMALVPVPWALPDSAWKKYLVPGCRSLRYTRWVKPPQGMPAPC